MNARSLRRALGVGLAAPLTLVGANTALAHAASPSVSSPYLAGYTSQLKGSGSIERLTVPAFSCPKGADARVAFGIADQGPDDPQPVVRTALDVLCDAEGGSAEYGTEVIVPGQALVSSSVSAGDVLMFRVTYGKHHRVVASVVDESDAGGSITLTGTAPRAALHFGALPIVEGDDFLLASPDFGRVDVVRATAAGAALTSQTTVRYKRVDSDHRTAIVASGFDRTSAGAGSFSLVFKQG